MVKINKKKESLLTLVAFVIMSICILFLRNATINDISMEPTLNNKDIVLVDFTYKINKLKRYDIVIIKDKTKKYIKRVIGLPGETIEIKDGNVYIDNVHIEDNYKKGHTTHEDGDFKITLGENEYYVLGDNREYSYDSRKMGVINKNKIIGRAWLKVYPLPFKKI